MSQIDGMLAQQSFHLPGTVHPVSGYYGHFYCVYSKPCSNPQTYRFPIRVCQKVLKHLAILIARI